MCQDKKYILSIVISCYNAGHYIDRCLKSVFGQVLEKDSFQVLLIDDASSDNTYEKLKIWEQKYPEQILLFHNQENLRQGTCRNIGMRYATGKYIGFVDADDWISPDMYKKLIFYGEQRQCEVVTCELSIEWGNEKYTDEDLYQEKQYKHFLLDDDAKTEFIAYNIIKTYVVTKLYRRDFLVKNSICFPEGIIFEDHLFIELVNVYVSSVVWINEKLYHYCMTPNSTVRTLNSVAHYDIVLASEYMWREFEERNLFTKSYWNSLEYRFIYYNWFVALKVLVVSHNPIPYDVIWWLREYILTKVPNYHTNWLIEGGFKEGSKEKIKLKLLDCTLKKKDLITILDKIKKSQLFI
ncbi:glycosyltransferase [Lachnospiraceae bacterium OttesenSCG-928-D06]|nr:glycosyltransferase [Lachnospiraceae bacterium OttesenSCG-928-D06]